jgi:hypothetical protein
VHTRRGDFVSLRTASTRAFVEAAMHYVLRNQELLLLPAAIQQNVTNLAILEKRRPISFVLFGDDRRFLQRIHIGGFYGNFF